MIWAQQRAFLIAADCEVALDHLTRQLHATDASIYQVEPAGVAFPRNASQASSVIRAPIYGTTADHVVSLEIVLADGRIEKIGPAHDTLRPQRELVQKLVHEYGSIIAERFPPGLVKRWPGYGLDRYLRELSRNDSVSHANLAHIFAGSEGTLAGIMSAELKITPLPRQKGLGLVFFASVTEAMEATVALLDLRPAAIEHIDRVLLDQTRGQLQFRAARDLLELDSK